MNKSTKEAPTNSNGDRLMSGKWIRPELYDYLKKFAKELHLTETAVINQALRLHKDKHGK